MTFEILDPSFEFFVISSLDWQVSEWGDRSVSSGAIDLCRCTKFETAKNKIDYICCYYSFLWLSLSTSQGSVRRIPWRRRIGD